MSVRTKEKVRYLAALLGDSQAEVVPIAIDEYVARHTNELEASLSRARQALQRGPVSEIAYLLNTDPEGVARVSGIIKAIQQG